MSIKLGGILWCRPELNPSGSMYGNRYSSQGPWHLRRWYRDARGRATHLRSDAACGLKPAWGWWGHDVFLTTPPEPQRLCVRCCRKADTL